MAVFRSLLTEELRQVLLLMNIYIYDENKWNISFFINKKRNIPLIFIIYIYIYIYIYNIYIYIYIYIYMMKISGIFRSI